MLGINVRPLSRLLAVSGAGGVLGALAVGGPIGIVGGLLLGGLAEEVIARAHARKVSAAVAGDLGWDYGRRRARFDRYGRPLALYGADPTAAQLQAQLNQMMQQQSLGGAGQTINQAAVVAGSVAKGVGSAVEAADDIANLIGSF